MSSGRSLSGKSCMVLSWGRFEDSCLFGSIDASDKPLSLLLAVVSILDARNEGTKITTTRKEKFFIAM